MKEANYYQVIKRLIFSEKASTVNQIGQYAFSVDIRATKGQIKRAIEYAYGVQVKKVNTLKVKGKTTNFKRIKGRRSDWKKAYVSLQEGQSINTGGQQ